MIAAYEGDRLPFPIGQRPDYRSSAPKIMPRQIKVPALRRWGKKMVVADHFFA